MFQEVKNFILWMMIGSIVYTFMLAIIMIGGAFIKDIIGVPGTEPLIGVGTAFAIGGAVTGFYAMLRNGWTK